MPAFQELSLKEFTQKIKLNTKYSMENLNQIFPDFIFERGISLQLDYLLWKMKKMDAKFVFTDKILENNVAGNYDSETRTVTISLKKHIGKKNSESFQFTIVHEIGHAAKDFDNYISKYHHPVFIEEAKMLDIIQMSRSAYIEDSMRDEMEVEQHAYKIYNDLADFQHENIKINEVEAAKNWINTDNVKNFYNNFYGKHHDKSFGPTFDLLLFKYSQLLTKKNKNLFGIINNPERQIKPGFWKTQWHNYFGKVEPGFVMDEIRNKQFWKNQFTISPFEKFKKDNKARQVKWQEELNKKAKENFEKMQKNMFLKNRPTFQDNLKNPKKIYFNQFNNRNQINNQRFYVNLNALPKKQNLGYLNYNNPDKFRKVKTNVELISRMIPRNNYITMQARLINPDTGGYLDKHKYSINIKVPR